MNVINTEKNDNIYNKKKTNYRFFQIIGDLSLIFQMHRRRAIVSTPSVLLSCGRFFPVAFLPILKTKMVRTTSFFPNPFYRWSHRLNSLCHEINHFTCPNSPPSPNTTVRAVAVELDLTADGPAINASVQKAWEAFGHVLMNNAGVRGTNTEVK